MDNVEWHPFFYNGQETNIEVTRCGRVRRVPKDWIRSKFYKHTYEVDLANLLKSRGYIVLGVNIKNFKLRVLGVHQMVASVYLNHTISGYSLVVDHIDSDKTNNHVDNLRLVTNRENSSKERTIKSGLPTGVSYNKQNKKYVTIIYIKGSNRFLGYHFNLEDASKAYEDALSSLNKFLKDTDDKGDQNEWFILYSEKNKIRKNKTHSLPKGIEYSYHKKVFTAKIRINKKKIYLGTYKIDASNAYQEAASSFEDWISENKDPNDWIEECKNKVKSEEKLRREVNKLIKKAQNLKEATSNIGEQVPTQFN
jgi:hypothetical protein